MFESMSQLKRWLMLKVKELLKTDEICQLLSSLAFVDVAKNWKQLVKQFRRTKVILEDISEQLKTESVNLVCQRFFDGKTVLEQPKFRSQSGDELICEEI